MQRQIVRVMRRFFPRLRYVPLRNVVGEGNLISTEGATLVNVHFDIQGNHNKIIIEKGAFLQNVYFRVRGERHTVRIGEDVRISRRGEIWMEDQEGLLQIGKGTTVASAHFAITEPGSRLLVGEDCMLATDIEIRTGDSHAIYDAHTGQRLNPAADVIIENHVWIGARAVILKGCRLGTGSVVATGAIVARSCPPQVIVAGNPARVIRENITWTRKRS